MGWFPLIRLDAKCKKLMRMRLLKKQCLRLDHCMDRSSQKR
ncbi:hypothetical protein Fuma_02860 [Fuerstiella marisgermanici]|uniref:Uncharacterized protein n=1 Tax=Fuerstiella marisgermanici TaxID=1891926 RepID=A0A1P8WGR7_9PLAN|nr:hypothetical protein Fuma_02860 [Fuerstiella marisgermanici]